MVTQSPYLALERCPHCGIAKPTLTLQKSFNTRDSMGGRQRIWAPYSCTVCGGVILTAASMQGTEVLEMYPSSPELDAAIPERAREFLRQARSSLHSPAGAVMLCASSVDAMMKARGHIKGKLFARIEAAKEAHQITPDLAAWAHEVRIDANEQRHDDVDVPIATEDDARRTLAFTEALAEYLFVLPSRIKRMRETTSETELKAGWAVTPSGGGTQGS